MKLCRGGRRASSLLALLLLAFLVAPHTASGWTWTGQSWADVSDYLGPIGPSVKQNCRAILATGTGLGREPGRMGQIGDSITYSWAYFLNTVVWGPVGNETGHDYGPIRSWLAYAGAQPADPDSWYGQYHGKEIPYGNMSGWTLDDAIAAGHPGVCVTVGENDVPGNFSWALLMFGTNDIDAPSWNADGWKETYRSFVQGFIELGVIPVLSTIPPEEAHVGDGRVEAANARIVDLANELLIPWVDFYAVILHYQPTTWLGTLISDDGTHPSAGGGGQDYSQDGLTTTDGYALRSKLSLDMAEKLRAIVFDDGPPDSVPLRSMSWSELKTLWRGGGGR